MGLLKLEKMEKLEAKAEDNIIKFDYDSYMELVVKNPRPYDVVMMYNVNVNCEHCIIVHDEYKQTAYSFIKERGVAQSTHKEKKTFFGVLFFTSEHKIQSIFRGHELTTVPYLAVSAQNSKRDAKMETFYETTDLWLIGSNEVYDAQKQIDFVNNHLRTDVKIKFTFLQILVKNMLGLVLISFLFFFVKYTYEILLNQFTWYAIAICVWVICTGGLVYSMLNSMPWFKFERNEYGQVVIAEYFMRGQRGQWAGEGYIASVLCTIIGLCYLALNNIEKYAEDRNTQRIAVMVLLISLYIMQAIYVAIYRFKSPWYNPVFSPPDYYLKGSFLQD